MDDALSHIAPGTSLLFGFFQRAEYVSEVWPQMHAYLDRHALTRGLLSSPRQEVIAVHMRLGDYMTNASAARTHGVVDPMYYRRAVETLIADGGLPSKVLLISDDPREARARLAGTGLASNVEVSVSTGTSPWDDLAQISSASGVVMSNSSFSWWGAFLAERRFGARVVYPNRWYVGGRCDSNPLTLPTWRSCV